MQLKRVLYHKTIKGVTCHGRLCNTISSHMSSSYAHAQAQAHAHRAVSDDPGWSLLRLSGAQRFGLACVVIAAVWATTLLVIV